MRSPPVLLVDRAPAETIDRDPVYVCPRHATPPVVMDLPQRADGERGGRVAATGGSESTGFLCFEDGGLKDALELIVLEVEDAALRTYP